MQYDRNELVCDNAGSPARYSQPQFRGGSPFDSRPARSGDQSRQIHALLGANGSGKTTLAYVFMGCEGYVPGAGAVLFNGSDLLPLKMYERARLGLTLAWQEPARFEGVTVREYLTLGKPDFDPAPALKQVGLDPDRYLDRRVDKSLSGGERHRIELASVLSMKPKLAILDEPAAGIDMLSITHIIGIIRALKAGGDQSS